MRYFQESSDGRVKKRLEKGVWEVVVPYRNLKPGHDPSEGKMAFGRWHEASRLTDVPCRKKDDLGRRRAEEQLKNYRRELEEAEPERARKEELERNRSEISGSTHVGDYVDHFLRYRLPQVTHKRLEPSTMSGYERRAGYIKNAEIASIPLMKLTRQDVEKFRNTLLKRYSFTTTRDVMRLLNRALQDAIVTDCIDVSPSRDVTLPKGGNTRRQNALDEDAVKTLMDDLRSANGHRWSPSVLGTWIALMAGLREEEVCALQWRDIDFRKKMIYVRRAIGRIGDSYYVKDTKTPKSRRDIPVMEDLLMLILKHRQSVSAMADELGEPFNKHWYVIGNFDKYLPPRSLYNNFRRRAKRLGLVGALDIRPCFNDLRHTFATTAIAEGMDVESLADILGHEDPSVTLNTYGQSNPKAKRLSMDNLGGYYRGLS